MANNIYVDPSTGKMQQGQSGSFTTPLSQYNPTPKATTTPAPAATASGGATTTSAPDELSSVRSALDAEMSSLLTPEEIQAKEEANIAHLREVAEGIFNPQIARARETGELREGSATGQLGVSRGLGFSTAERSYIASIEQQTEDSIREIETAKANYIKTGMMEYADRAEAQIENLRTLKINLLGKKAEMIIGERAEKRADRAATLAEKGFELQKQSQSFTENLALTNLTGTITGELAGILGVVPGTETFAKAQADIQTAMQEAGLTGFYNGKKTNEAQWQDFQRLMQEKGYDLNVAQFEEAKRSTAVQESFEKARIQIARASEARLAAKDTQEETTFLEDIDNAAMYLSQLKGTENFNDAVWNNEVNKVIAMNGYEITDENTKKMVSSALAQKLENMDIQANGGRQLPGDVMTMDSWEANGSNQYINARATTLVNNYMQSGMSKAEAKNQAQFTLKLEGYNDLEVDKTVGNIIERVFAGVSSMLK